MNYNVYIGIDCGVNTGIAVWKSMGKRSSFELVKTVPIHQALEIVMDYWNKRKNLDEYYDYQVTVIVEDARQRKYLPKEKNLSEYRGRLMGAGSVKRDAGIWEDFLKDKGIPYLMKAPQKGATKLSPETFKLLTGYEGRTSNHGRDAAMLVFGK